MLANEDLEHTLLTMTEINLGEMNEKYTIIYN